MPETWLILFSDLNRDTATKLGTCFLQSPKFIIKKLSEEKLYRAVRVIKGKGVKWNYLNAMISLLLLTNKLITTNSWAICCLAFYNTHHEGILICESLDKENIFNYLLNRKTRTFIYLHLYQTRLLTTRTYQALAWCVGDSPCPCCHSCKSRKRRLRWAMKSLLKGKAAWADIACTKF